MYDGILFVCAWNASLNNHMKLYPSQEANISNMDVRYQNINILYDSQSSRLLLYNSFILSLILDIDYAHQTIIYTPYNINIT